MREPQINEVWRHAHGGEYIVEHRATLKSPSGDSAEDGAVVYRPYGENKHFVRSLENFTARFTYVRDLEFLVFAGDE